MPRGRPSPLAPEKLDFLRSYLAEFEDSQPHLGAFWKKVEKEYLERWPVEHDLGLPLLSTHGVLIEDSGLPAEHQRAVGEAQKKAKDVIHHWYNNTSQTKKRRLNGAAAGSVAREEVVTRVLSQLGKKSTRRLQKMEIWQRRNRNAMEIALQAAGFAELSAYSDDEETTEARTARKKRERQDQMKMRRAVAKTQWEGADAAEKEAVTAEYEAQVKKKSEAVAQAQTPEQFMSGLDNIGPFLKGFHSILADMTGWVGGTLLTGPVPNKGGQIGTTTYCHGVAPKSGHTLDQAMPRWAENVVAPLQQFGKSVFDHATRRSRAIQVLDTPTALPEPGPSSLNDDLIPNNRANDAVTPKIPPPKRKRRPRRSHLTSVASQDVADTIPAETDAFLDGEDRTMFSNDEPNINDSVTTIPIDPVLLPPSRSQLPAPRPAWRTPEHAADPNVTMETASVQQSQDVSPPSFELRPLAADSARTADLDALVSSFVFASASPRALDGVETGDARQLSGAAPGVLPASPHTPKGPSPALSRRGGAGVVVPSPLRHVHTANSGGDDLLTQPTSTPHKGSVWPIVSASARTPTPRTPSTATATPTPRLSAITPTVAPTTPTPILTSRQGAITPRAAAAATHAMPSSPPWPPSSATPTSENRPIASTPRITAPAVRAPEPSQPPSQPPSGLTATNFPQSRPMSNPPREGSGSRGARGGPRGGRGGTRGGARGGRGAPRGQGRGGNAGAGRKPLAFVQTYDDAGGIINLPLSTSLAPAVSREQLKQIRDGEKARDATQKRVQARLRNTSGNYDAVVFPPPPPGHEALQAEPGALGARVRRPPAGRADYLYEPPVKRTREEIRENAEKRKRKADTENEEPSSKRVKSR
ncbi:hypothetical protein C8R43DRAFT_1141681 [Mycena crocata]|nr:hypothetical protein C8R43DRAFT_1141681 [Mycena crocata]